MTKSRQTTISGLAAAAAAVAAYVWPDHSSIIMSVMGIFIAYGLVQARDHAVSSKSAGIEK